MMERRKRTIIQIIYIYIYIHVIPCISILGDGHQSISRCLFVDAVIKDSHYGMDDPSTTGNSTENWRKAWRAHSQDDASQRFAQTDCILG